MEFGLFLNKLHHFNGRVPWVPDHNPTTYLFAFYDTGAEFSSCGHLDEHEATGRYKQFVKTVSAVRPDIQQKTQFARECAASQSAVQREVRSRFHLHLPIMFPLWNCTKHHVSATHRASSTTAPITWHFWNQVPSDLRRPRVRMFEASGRLWSKSFFQFEFVRVLRARRLKQPECSLKGEVKPLHASRVSFSWPRPHLETWKGRQVLSCTKLQPRTDPCQWKFYTSLHYSALAVSHPPTHTSKSLFLNRKFARTKGRGQLTESEWWESRCTKHLHVLQRFFTSPKTHILAKFERDKETFGHLLRWCASQNEKLHHQSTIHQRCEAGLAHIALQTSACKIFAFAFAMKQLGTGVEVCTTTHWPLTFEWRNSETRWIWCLEEGCQSNTYPHLWRIYDRVSGSRERTRPDPHVGSWPPLRLFREWRSDFFRIGGDPWDPGPSLFWFHIALDEIVTDFVLVDNSQHSKSDWIRATLHTSFPNFSAHSKAKILVCCGLFLFGVGRALPPPREGMPLSRTELSVYPLGGYESEFRCTNIQAPSWYTGIVPTLYSSGAPPGALFYQVYLSLLQSSRFRLRERPRLGEDFFKQRKVNYICGRKHMESLAQRFHALCFQGADK